MKLIERITAAFHEVAYDIVNLYNVPNIVHNSGRIYCYTDNRWITDSDDNYGVSYYQFSEPAGTGTDPIMGWEHKGVFVPKDMLLRKIDFIGNSNNTEVTDLEIMIVHRYPTNQADWNTGIASDNAMTNVTIHRDLFMAATTGIAFTGATNRHRRRSIFLNYKVPQDGWISIYFKPVGTISATRYYRCAYTYSFSPIAPNT